MKKNKKPENNPHNAPNQDNIGGKTPRPRPANERPAKPPTPPKGGSGVSRKDTTK